MRSLTSLLTLCSLAMITTVASADPIFTWRDHGGGLHFSNRSEVIPAGASAVDLPPLPPRVTTRSRAASVAVARVATVASRGVARRDPVCGTPDPSGVVEAVAARLGRRQLDGLTVIVAGVPLSASESARVETKGPDTDAGAATPAEQAALAYPARSGCLRARPPLERYSVASGPRNHSRGLCDDYRRAFAEVGIAVSRDQGVARSFRSAAEHFIEVAGRDYAAGGRELLVPAIVREAPMAPTGLYRSVGEERVPLPQWAVEAHIAQTSELDVESSALVDELTAALDTIDAAARRVGCW